MQANLAWVENQYLSRLERSGALPRYKTLPFGILGRQTSFLMTETVLPRRPPLLLLALVLSRLLVLVPVLPTMVVVVVLCLWLGVA